MGIELKEQSAEASPNTSTLQSHKQRPRSLTNDLDTSHQVLPAIPSSTRLVRSPNIFWIESDSLLLIKLALDHVMQTHRVI